MECELSSRWYAAQAKQSQERTALYHLQRQNFIAYYPEISIERSRNGKVVSEKEGLFPGYIFINFILETWAWRTINSTRGILRLLSFSENGKPCAVPNGQIELLQAQEKSGEFRFSEIPFFRKGDRIKIKNGPSVGQHGTVIRTRGQRIELLVQLLGRQVKCIAPQHILSMVEQRAPVPQCGSHVPHPTHTRALSA